MTDRRPLYVRLPVTVADRLDHAAVARRTSKQDLVAELVANHLGADDAPRRVTVETSGDGLTVGRHGFRPAPAPEVLTLAQAAELLQVSEATVRGLADAGELPGREVGGEWRFSRAAVLGWLAAA